MADGFKKTECLIIGANGLVGRRLGEVLTRNRISWHGTFHSRQTPGLSRLDIRDRTGVRDIVSEINPASVFMCANLAGGVDFCQANPAKAREFHLDGVKNIVNASSGIDAALTFISSDYIFDGEAGSYREDGRPNPLNLYGRLKLEAEKVIEKGLKKYIIIRTTNVFGWDPDTKTPNFIMNLYRALKAGRPFTAPSYLWGSPTYAMDLADAMVELFVKKAGGTFHVVGSSFINRYEWAMSACEALGLDRRLVMDAKYAPANMVPRPLRSSLIADKFSGSYATRLHNAADGLLLMRREMDAGRGQDEI